MQNGKILTLDTPQNISDSYPEKLLAVKATKMSTLLKSLSNFQGALNSYAFGEYAHVVLQNDETDIENRMKKYLEHNGLMNVEIKPIKATIEDSFIKLLK
jgi:ABC-type multidrug transport system ATPase subunit